MNSDEWLKKLGPLPPAPTHERRFIGMAHHPTTWEVASPMIAMLPDGSATPLPVGTTVQEGTTWGGTPADPLRDLLTALKTSPDPALAVMIGKLVTQIELGSIPLLSQARALLQRARLWVGGQPPGCDDHREQGHYIVAEIDAFLAGICSSATAEDPAQTRDPEDAVASTPSSCADADER